MAGVVGILQVQVPSSAHGHRAAVPAVAHSLHARRGDSLLAPKQHAGSTLQLKHVCFRQRALSTVTTAFGGAKQYTVDVDKPIGIKLKEVKNEYGGVQVTDVSGNGSKAGIEKGDTIIMASSFFGDELWPCDSLNFTRTALAKAPSPVSLVYVKGVNESINVRRLPKKPAPAKFGRALTPQQTELATHICLDCGYVYTQRKPFEEQSQDYRCPQCQAPKKRFALYDAETGKPKGGFNLAGGSLFIVLGGLAVLAVLFYAGLKV